MLTPMLPSAHEPGKRWLQAQVEQILATGAVALAPPRAEGAPGCYWGTAPETETTLYFLLAGETVPQALAFPRAMLVGCGSGLYSTQHYATLFIRRMLRKMGILPT
jgi:hypothetical protein